MVQIRSIVVAGVLAATAPSAMGQVSSRPSSELEPIEFVLEDVKYRIQVPKTSRLSDVNDPGCVKIWHPHATRSMTFLELCSSPGAVAATYGGQANLSDGARVRYNINHNIGGGSGGAEGELKGTLDFHGKVFVLTCRDQGEWGNNPGWCLHYLPYLEVRDRK